MYFFHLFVCVCVCVCVIHILFSRRLNLLMKFFFLLFVIVSLIYA